MKSEIDQAMWRASRWEHKARVAFAAGRLAESADCYRKATKYTKRAQALLDKQRKGNTK